MPYTINVDQIKRAARSAVPLAIKTYTLPHETENYLEEILGIFLEEFGQQDITDRLAYIMKELAVNAKKANTKRVYFLDRDLDIKKADDYQVGMKTFKTDTLGNLKYYLDKQKDAGLYIKVVFQSKGKIFSLSVRNNTKISKKEQMRVYDRIARARAFESMEEALSSVLDDSEGAGLGIVILVLMLKKMGLDEDAFDIDVIGDDTVAKISIPFSKLHLENMNELAREIVNEVKELPQFPDSIVFLQKLINDPDSEITDIARQISTDPSMTADLLKLVNSAQYVLPKRVDNIVEAVKMVGLRGIKNLLYSYGTQKILKNGQKSLWDHSYKAAFYAYTLARSFKKKQELLDDAYVGGILHDMGKIIFSTVHPDLLEKISNFCTTKAIDKDLFEDLSAGLNHAEIGGLIAEKWNFPDSLIEAIKHHHEPLECSKEYADVVNTVYLANCICNIEDKSLTFDQIETKVLEDFNISTEEQLMLIQKRLDQAFQRNAEKM